MKSMTTRKKCQKERDDLPTQRKKMKWRVKRTRRQEVIDPRAKKKTLWIKMGNMENTKRPRKEQKVAVKAVRKRGHKAEKKDTNTKLLRKGHSPEAKTERTLRKINTLNLNMEKKKQNMMNLEKNIKMMLKEETAKELDPSPVARTKPLKIGTDLAAETEIRVVETNQETKTTGGTETRAGITAEVETIDAIVKGKLRGESHPEVEAIEGEVQIEVRQETLTGAGILEAKVRKESQVKTVLLIERIKSENLATTKDDIAAAAAAALTVIERKKRPARALTANPKTKEVQKSKSQTVLEAKITIKDIVLLAQVLTVTDMALQCLCRSLQHQFLIYQFNLVLLRRAPFPSKMYSIPNT